MVDLGQKGYVRVPFLFCINSNNKHKKRFGNFPNLFVCKETNYFASAYLLATSDQLITLKKASI